MPVVNVCEVCRDNPATRAVFRSFSDSRYRARWYDVCDQCASTFPRGCANCNRRFSYIRDMSRCSDCDTYRETCRDCNEPVDHDNGRLMRGDAGTWETVCGDCLRENYSYCRSCDNYVNNGDTVSVLNGGEIEEWCHSCASLYTNVCMECGERYHGDTSDGRCPNCRTLWVRGYHDNPRRYYMDLYSGVLKVGNAGAKTYFGVEMEFEMRGAGQLEVVQALEDYLIRPDVPFYLMHDGSLSYGIELITQPLTLRAHRNGFEWRAITDMLRSMGCRSHNTETCGLHVHVSKTAIHSELHLARIDMFVHAHQAFYERLGRRQFGGYCAAKADKSAIMPRKCLTNRELEMRFAVNWSNRNTVEFRFPRGTLQASTILATIELCDATIAFCNLHSALFLSRAIESRNTFVDWVRDSADYPYLINYFEERGI